MVPTIIQLARTMRRRGRRRGGRDARANDGARAPRMPARAGVPVLSGRSGRRVHPHAGRGQRCCRGGRTPRRTAKRSDRSGRTHGCISGIVLAVFPLIFFGELPDKTMFASLLLASRGRPLAVWVGAATGVHGARRDRGECRRRALSPAAAPRRRRAGRGAVRGRRRARVSRDRGRGGATQPRRSIDEHRAQRAPGASTTAFVVIFLAEWGDLTQVLTANLAARYHSPLSVGLGAMLALLSVSAIATFSGTPARAHPARTAVAPDHGRRLLDPRGRRLGRDDPRLTLRSASRSRPAGARC